MAGYIGSKASVVSSGAERKKTFTITGATTSLTGLNYTVGKVHVFQNGVRLVDGTDYTATNGTTITLTVAAQSGDNVVVISQAAFQVALSGIDDQSNATALTIDSSENILAGKTSADFGATAGLEFRGGATDTLFLASDGNKALALNRNTSDGEIIRFSKSDSTVGAIGTGGGGINFNSQGSDFAIRRSGTDVLYVGATASYPGSDNSKDLGVSSFRWKDAYLSGGVYLGGTGSANKLDDYEEGTWEPTIVGSGSNPTVTYQSDNGGSYTKIGRVVYYTGAVRWTALSGGSGTARIGNLPFTSAARTNGDNADSVGSARTSIWNGTSSNHPTVIGMVANNTTLNIVANASTGTSATLQISDLGTNCAFQFTCIAYV